MSKDLKTEENLNTLEENLNPLEENLNTLEENLNTLEENFNPLEENLNRQTALNYKLIVEEGSEPYYLVTTGDGFDNYKISKESLSKIAHVVDEEFKWDFVPRWIKGKNNYIYCFIPYDKMKFQKIKGEQKIKKFKNMVTLYLHRYLKNVYKFNRKYTVDHKNKCRDDNRLENLRICSQTEQSHNQSRKIRKPIKLRDFNVEIILPQYIRYVNGSNNQDHFVVESDYFRFFKHATRTASLSMQKKLADAIELRYNAIIQSDIDFVVFYIDEISFYNIEDLKKHHIDLIKKLCNIELSDIKHININDSYYKRNNYDPNIEKKFPESDMTNLTVDNIPREFGYTKANNNRGSYLSYRKANNINEFYSTSSQYNSLDEKLIQIIKKSKKEKIKLTWINKPQWINLDDTIDEDMHVQLIFQRCETMIKKHLKLQENRQFYNELDIVIVNKLKNELGTINKSVVSDIIKISDDNVSTIESGELRKDIETTFLKDLEQHPDFKEMYDKFKKQIIDETQSRKDKQEKQVKDLSSTKKGKVSTDTKIQILKLKGKLKYEEIARMFKNEEGEQLTMPTVSCICSPNVQAHKMKESDFIGRTDMTYEEYIKILNYNAHKDIQTKYFSGENNGMNKNKETESTIKLYVSLDTIFDILKLKIKDNKITYAKLAEQFYKIDGDPLTLDIIKCICYQRSPYDLTSKHFEGQSKYTYDEYTALINKLPRKVSTIKEYSEDSKKTDVVQEVVDNSTRTVHINTILHIINDKHSSLSFEEIAKKYKKKDGSNITENIVRSICCAKSSYKLDETEFNGITFMDYKTYLEKVNKKKELINPPPEIDYTKHQGNREISRDVIVQVIKLKGSLTYQQIVDKGFLDINNKKLTKIKVQKICSKSGVTKLQKKEFELIDPNVLTWDEYQKLLEMNQCKSLSKGKKS
uniref:HNH nuclease domain-containing protein n=1 Tax=viral metagenome TaxID=1070528 RepID=A0A6C0E6X0_9ZZZZ